MPEAVASAIKRFLCALSLIDLRAFRLVEFIVSCNHPLIRLFVPGAHSRLCDHGRRSRSARICFSKASLTESGGTMSLIS